MIQSATTIILFAHKPFANFLSDSLASLVNQSYSSLEVIVLSDGSQEIANVAAGYMATDARVSVAPQRQLPFLQMANQIMKDASGEYLGTWNCDDIYNKDHVKLLVEMLADRQEIGAAFDNVEYFDDASAGDRSPPQSHLMIPKTRAEKLAVSDVSLQEIFLDNLVCAPACLIRKSAFERVGGYDKDIMLNCDLHWSYRIAACFPMRFVNYVGVRKRIHPLNNTAVNSHYELGVSELEHIRDHYPEVYNQIGKKVFNRKLGRKYFRLGSYYEDKGNLEMAREMYRQAVLLRPLNLHYGWEYCRSAMARVR